MWDCVSTEVCQRVILIDVSRIYAARMDDTCFWLATELAKRLNVFMTVYTTILDVLKNGLSKHRPERFQFTP